MNKRLMDLFAVGQVAVYEDGSPEHMLFLQYLENSGYRWRNSQLPTEIFNNDSEFLIINLGDGLARGRIKDLQRFYPEAEFHYAEEMLKVIDMSTFDDFVDNFL